MTSIVKSNEIVVNREVWANVYRGLSGKVFIAEKFKAFIRVRFSSQKVGAKYIGVSTATVNKLGNGLMYPSPIIIAKLEKAFGETNFLISLAPVKKRKPHPILWGKLALAFGCSPTGVLASRKLLKGRTCAYLLRTGATVSPALLKQLCELVGVEVNEILHEKCPEVNDPVIEHAVRHRLRGQSILQTAMRAKGIRVSDLSREIGMDRAGPTSWLYDGKIPTFSSHLKLCHYFNVRFDFWADWLTYDLKAA